MEGSKERKAVIKKIKTEVVIVSLLLGHEDQTNELYFYVINNRIYFLSRNLVREGVDTSLTNEEKRRLYVCKNGKASAATITTTTMNNYPIRC